MRERPILFSAPMVRAIFDERQPKTQTRRAVKLPHQNPLGQWEPTTFGGTDARGVEHDEQAAIWHTRTGDTIACPYGKPGDRLWVREAFSGPHNYDQEKWPPRAWFTDDPIWYWADGNPESGDWTRPKPSIHMPRWASRITLEITDVRVQRLQECSEADAEAEGIMRDEVGGAYAVQAPFNYPTAIAAYAALWDAINGAGAWDANPWVWVVEFKRVKP